MEEKLEPAIIIPSRKVYYEVCRYFRQKGIKWCSGTTTGPGYHRLLEDAKASGAPCCIHYEDNELSYCERHYFENSDIEIITFEEYLSRFNKPEEDYSKLPRRIKVRK
jgi:hypothetical protein